MTDKPESGDIGASVYPDALHGFPCISVQERHGSLHFRIFLFRQKVDLGCSCQDSRTDFLGDDQQVSFTGAVAENIVRMRKTRHGQSVFRLFIIYAVTSHDRSTRFIDLVISAFKYRLDNIQRQLVVRECQQVHGEFWLSTHRIDITQ